MMATMLLPSSVDANSLAYASAQCVLSGGMFHPNYGCHRSMMMPRHRESPYSYGSRYRGYYDPYYGRGRRQGLFGRRAANLAFRVGTYAVTEMAVTGLERGFQRREENDRLADSCAAGDQVSCRVLAGRDPRRYHKVVRRVSRMEEYRSASQPQAESNGGIQFPAKNLTGRKIWVQSGPTSPRILPAGDTILVYQHPVGYYPLPTNSGRGNICFAERRVNAAVTGWEFFISQTDPPRCKEIERRRR